MRYFIDTEFYEFAPTRAVPVPPSREGGGYGLSSVAIPGANAVQLISIGVVAEDGREFYAESTGFDWDYVPEDHWLQDNVRPHLSFRDKSRIDPGDRTHLVYDRTRVIANRLREFVGDAGTDPEFWGYYADYDWVVVCGLFGRMVDLPNGWPMYCRDLKQLADERGVDDLPRLEGGAAHHALHDAREIAYRYDWMQ